MTVLSLNNVSWHAGGSAIINRISLEVMKGDFLGIVGPNGSGKTTLISLIAGTRKLHGGEIRLFNRPFKEFRRHEIAHYLALVEQQAETTEKISARQAVELGRIPYLNALKPWSIKDDTIVDTALEQVSMAHLASRSWQTLSGGERQRLHIARALAQQPEIMLLDEPTNHLDIHHQIGLLHLVREQKLTIVAALHDLNLAAMFCNRIAMMQEGEIVALGLPQDILTPENIQKVFSVTSTVNPAEDGSCFIRFMKPRPSHRSDASFEISSTN